MEKPGPSLLSNRSVSAKTEHLGKLTKVLVAYFKKWKLVFPTHEISKEQLGVYLQALSGLTIGELEDGCREVIKISLTFPKPAEIIAAARECTGEGFSGPPLLDYQDITDAEREAAFAENAEFTAKLKAQLGVGQVIKSPTRSEERRVG